MRASTLLALLPLAFAAPSASVPRHDSLARVIVSRDGNGVAGKYIVKMKETASRQTVESAVSRIGRKADYVYKIFNGFAASLTDEELQTLRADPNVDFIEQDTKLIAEDTQEDAPWGLARISSASPGGTTYTFDSNPGAGTCAYVLDTGIDIAHEDFGGRAVFGENFTDDGDSDGTGHGTHVAGTIGGTVYGVAKQTSLIAVKVLNDVGTGVSSRTMEAMEWVIGDSGSRDCPNGVVVNMSLSGAASEAYNQAVAAMADAGIFVAVAAGNQATDVSERSPASAEAACTVAGTSSDDSWYTSSNFGAGVNILAPAVSVLSASVGGGGEEKTGTSMASPHVAGLGAYLMAKGTAAGSVCQELADTAITSAISGVPEGTTDRLANNGYQ